MIKLNELKEILFGKVSIEVWWNYAKYSFYIAFLTILVFFLTPPYKHLLLNWKKWIQLVGIIFFVIPYAQVGWKFQTWGGDAPHEKLNRGLAKLSVFIGYTLTIIAFCLYA